MSDMQKFNSVLKKYLTEAKILEKTHPKRSIPIWLNLVDFIITFAKSKNCPYQLRKKLVVQAEQVLTRAKALQAQYDPISLPATSNSTSSQFSNLSTISGITSQPINHSNPNNQPISDLSEIDLLSLPDVPTEEQMTFPDPPESNMKTPPPNNFPTSSNSSLPPTSLNNQTPYPPTSTINPFNSSHKNENPNKNQNENQSDNVDPTLTLKNIERLEQELKKMPSNLKEINPSSFASPSLPPNNHLDEFKGETILLDVTSFDVGSSPSSSTESNPSEAAVSASSPSFKIRGTITEKDHKIHPLGTKDTDPTNIKDAFGPNSIPNTPSNGTNQKVCFACGAVVEPYVKHCTECGTQLE